MSSAQPAIFIDELAAAAGVDPIAFRLRYLGDPRARTVIERATAKAGWSKWQKREGIGHGVGFARYKSGGAYCAVVAELETKAEVHVHRLVIAVDVGLVINPDGVANQIEGGAIQATSWTLEEAVRFDRARVTSDSWQAYPIPLLGGAGGRRRDRVAPGLSGGGSRRSGAGPDRGGDRECGVRCARHPRARAAADGRADPGRHRVSDTRDVCSEGKSVADLDDEKPRTCSPFCATAVITPS